MEKIALSIVIGAAAGIYYGSVKLYSVLSDPPPNKLVSQEDNLQ